MRNGEWGMRNESPPPSGIAFGDLLLARHSMRASSALASFVGSPYEQGES